MTPRHLIEPGRLAGAVLLRAQTDSRLVDLTRAGNDRAFEAIVDRYRRPLLRYCARILPDGRGEDAVQQVFLNAYDALHRASAPTSLKAWLFAIAHNVSLNVLRQRGSGHEQLEADHVAAETADDTFEGRERFREVLAAVAALPPSQRDALVLRELEGRGHEEIARELGVTDGAARQLISRARNGIRAAAASFLPLPLIMRLTDGTAPPPTAARLAELTAAGGGLTLTKVVATAAVGGTLIGGAVKGPDIAAPDRDRGDAGAAQAAEVDHAGSADDAHRAALGARAPTGEDRAGSGRGGGEGADERSGDDDGSNSGPGGGGDDGMRDDDSGSNSGPGGGGDDGMRDDDGGSNSGPGGGDGEFDDHSDPGSGDDGTRTDSSGPGSGDDGAETLELPMTGGSTDDGLTDPESSSGSGTSGSD